MPLFKAKPGEVNRIRSVSCTDKVRQFLFTLGCSAGEEITLVSVLAGTFIVAIKDSRYAIDMNFAKSIDLV